MGDEAAGQGQDPATETHKVDDLSGDLQEEIRMLRRVMRQTLRKGENDSRSDLKSWVSMLNALSSAAARLTTLLKTQHELDQSDVDDVAAALKNALEQLQGGRREHN